MGTGGQIRGRRALLHPSLSADGTGINAKAALEIPPVREDPQDQGEHLAKFIEYS
jgi:hypothetical protein